MGAMRRLRKWLGKLHRHQKWGASNTRKTAGVTWPQGETSAARKLRWPKLDWGSSHVGGACKWRVIQKKKPEALSLSKTKKGTFDPPGINATIQVNMEKGKTQRIPGRNVFRVQRRRSRKVLVTGLPAWQKVSHGKKSKLFTFRKKKKPEELRRRQSAQTTVQLQTQIDGLVETMADCSVQLLAKRQAELEHCKYMGDRILDSRRNFLRVTGKGLRRHRWRKACVLCTCCC